MKQECYHRIATLSEHYPLSTSTLRTRVRQT
jgi:hypothetical protein